MASLASASRFGSRLTNQLIFPLLLPSVRCESLQNWSSWKKWYITFVGGLLVLDAYVTYQRSCLPSLASDLSFFLSLRIHSSFASSVPGGFIPQMTQVFGMNSIEGILVISIFVAGCKLPFFLIARSNAALSRASRLTVHSSSHR
jgi:hypothetical protein